MSIYLQQVIRVTTMIEKNISDAPVHVVHLVNSRPETPTGSHKKNLLSYDLDKNMHQPHGNSLWHPGAPAPGLLFDFSNFENASEKSEKKLDTNIRKCRTLV